MKKNMIRKINMKYKNKKEMLDTWFIGSLLTIFFSLTFFVVPFMFLIAITYMVGVPLPVGLDFNLIIYILFSIFISGIATFKMMNHILRNDSYNET